MQSGASCIAPIGQTNRAADRFRRRHRCGDPGVATGCIRFAGQRGALIAPPGGILIACGNERGNIEKAILRMPRFGRAQEILFVGGYSADFEECERVATATRVLS